MFEKNKSKDAGALQRQIDMLRKLNVRITNDLKEERINSVKWKSKFENLEKQKNKGGSKKGKEKSGNYFWILLDRRAWYKYIRWCMSKFFDNNLICLEKKNMKLNWEHNILITKNFWRFRRGGICSEFPWYLNRRNNISFFFTVF